MVEVLQGNRSVQMLQSMTVAFALKFSFQTRKASGTAGVLTGNMRLKKVLTFVLQVCWQNLTSERETVFQDSVSRCLAVCPD